MVKRVSDRGYGPVNLPSPKPFKALESVPNLTDLACRKERATSLALLLQRNQTAAMTEQDFNLRLRLVFGPEEMIGPGKAELLERIARTGSIAAAGREMGMSYKRAWMLVETMNAMFKAPVVTSSRGGARGGGAQVTETGNEVLQAYRALVEKALHAGIEEIEQLNKLRNSTEN